MRTVKRTAGGFSLLLALGLIAVMTIAVALLMTRSASQAMLAGGVTAQALAASRAEAAAELAVSRIRSGTAGPIGAFALCTDVASCAAANMVHVSVDNASLPLAQGGGRQYEYWVYRSALGVGGVGGAFTVIAQGFYGNAGSPNLAVAEVQVEIEAATAGSTDFKCTEYDCR